mgnify:CR=1 FL=1
MIKEHCHPWETPASLGKVIEEFFSMYHGMLDKNVYGAYQVGIQGVAHSKERPMANDTKRLILKNTWVYLKSMQCFVSEDCTISQ